MKTQNGLFKLVIVILFLSTACSSSDDIEKEANVTKCFIIKEKDTDLPVTNTNIFFEGGDLLCGSVLQGCSYAIYTFKKTDNNGEVCITLSQSDLEAVKGVSCLWNNSAYHFATFDSLSNLSVIYVDKDF